MKLPLSDFTEEEVGYLESFLPVKLKSLSVEGITNSMNELEAEDPSKVFKLVASMCKIIALNLKPVDKMGKVVSINYKPHAA